MDTYNKVLRLATVARKNAMEEQEAMIDAVNAWNSMSNQHIEKVGNDAAKQVVMRHATELNDLDYSDLLGLF